MDDRKTCSSCGAGNYAEAPHCWQCFATSFRAETVGAPAPALLPVGDRPAQSSAFRYGSDDDDPPQTEVPAPDSLPAPAPTLPPFPFGYESGPTGVPTLPPFPFGYESGPTSAPTPLPNSLGHESGPLSAPARPPISLGHESGPTSAPARPPVVVPLPRPDRPAVAVPPPPSWRPDHSPPPSLDSTGTRGTGRKLAGRIVVGSILLVVGVIAALAVVRYLDRSSIQLPGVVAGHTSIQTPDTERFREEFRAEASLAGTDLDVGIYGVGGVPTFVLAVWEEEDVSVEEAFRLTAEGFNDATGGPGGVDIDLADTTQRDGTSFVCAPVTGVAPGAMCLWKDQGTYGMVFEFDVSVHQALDLTAVARQAYLG